MRKRHGDDADDVESSVTASSFAPFHHVLVLAQPVTALRRGTGVPAVTQSWRRSCLTVGCGRGGSHRNGR